MGKKSQNNLQGIVDELFASPSRTPHTDRTLRPNQHIYD